MKHKLENCEKLTAELDVVVTSGRDDANRQSMDMYKLRTELQHVEATLAATAKANEVLKSQLVTSDVVYTAEAKKLLHRAEEASEAEVSKLSAASAAASQRALEVAGENNSLRAEIKKRDEEIHRQSVQVAMKTAKEREEIE